MMQQRPRWDCTGSQHDLKNSEQILFPTQQLLQCFGAKDTYFGAKDRYFSAKDMYFGAKDMYFSAKDMYFGAKDMYFSAKDMYFGAKDMYFSIVVFLSTAVYCSFIHHSLFITLLLGSIAQTMLVKQPCYIQKCIDYFEK